MTRAEKVAAVLAASRQLVPQIRCLRHSVGTDGKTYYCGFPNGVQPTGEIRLMGYAFVDRISGCTVGKRYPTEADAVIAHNKYQDANAADFAAAMAEMDDARIDSQYEHWVTKRLPTHAGLRSSD